MIFNVLPLLVALAGSLLIEAAPRACGMRLPRGQGSVLLLLIVTAVFGFWLALAGNAWVATMLTVALAAFFIVASSAKKRMLGEPLVFSDLALIGSMVRHPRFYFTALSIRQRWLLAAGASVALVLLVLLSSMRLRPHLSGIALLLCALVAVPALLRSRWFATIARTPDLEGDIARYGLIATLAIYWWRWRRTADPELASFLDPDTGAPEIVVVVQCESFADPVDLAGAGQAALPHLSEARARAWQWGDLHVSGFGAYTMRTEYGVLFGRSEAALGFRRYDPFLSALGERSYALPARLRGSGYRCTFVHPHDLRFYGRNQLMPAIGFDDLIGRDGFAARAPDEARYIDDRTLGAAILRLVDRATAPTLIHAVTMENHGPWDGAGGRDARGRLDAYLRHLHNSDAMLGDLVAALSRGRRRALLVFYGDHRPSIPGVTTPGHMRHTPYVMLRFDADGLVASGPGRVDLTPASLHHAIVRCMQSNTDANAGKGPRHDEPAIGTDP